MEGNRGEGGIDDRRVGENECPLTARIHHGAKILELTGQFGECNAIFTIHNVHLWFYRCSH